MAIGVDSSKWKPRSIKGTPANKFRNILGVGILTAGLLCGAIFHFSSFTTGLRTATEKLYVDPISEVERKLKIAAGLPTESAAELRREFEEADRIDQPYK